MEKIQVGGGTVWWEFLELYEVLESMGQKSFGFCSVNLLLLSLSSMQYMYAEVKNDMLIQYNFAMLVKYLKIVIKLMKLGYNIPSFSVSMDASNVSKPLALSTAHKSIIGGVNPNHVISI